MEDQQILTLFWDRDETAIAKTEEQYGHYCRQVAVNILQDRQDAEECVNDTWLRAWNAIPPDRPKRLQFYLARITRNLALDRFRARNAQKRGSGETAAALDELSVCISSNETPEKTYEAKELEAAVNRFVRALPEREGNVFIRRYFFLESAGQIGKRYAISDNHVTVILSRTRKKLHTFLKKEGFL